MSSLSDEANWAVTALRLDDRDQVEKWFTAVCDSYQDPAAEDPVPDFVMFVQQLYDKAAEASVDNEKVNWFTEGLESHASDPLAVLAELFEARDSLPDLYDELVAEAEGGEAEESAAPEGSEAEEWAKYSPGEWYEYLTQTIGQGWNGWNGNEAEWAGFWEYFLAYAEQAGVRGPAEELLTEINGAEDKVAAFADHGITLVTEWWNFSPAQWYEYLTKTMGDGWTGWDGEEDSWDEFVQRFLSYAEQLDVRASAQLFLAEIEASGDKVAAFAEYDIQIGEPEPTVEQEPVAVEAEQDDQRVRWVAFLQDNAHRYQGTASSWTFFRGWLLAEARTQGFADEAAEFVELADGLDNQADAFARYGVTLAGAAEASEAEAEPPAEDVQEAMAELQQAVDEIVADNPDFEAIPAERRQELLNEVLEEIAAEGGG